MKKAVLGIIAHVDSGKTTLSEAILFNTGIIKSLGRVDHGDAFMDTHEIEKDRGITIFSNQAVFKLNGNEYSLLDTPGHVDFATETERILKVLDYAILVISGTDGVQSHTETLWKLLYEYNIPVFIFVNKMDIAPYSRTVLIKQIKAKLGDECVDFSDTSLDAFAEEIAMCDEELMESFLENGKIDFSKIPKLIKNRKVFPCYFGTALKNEGVLELLSGIDKFSSEVELNCEFGARVYKIAKDDKNERLTYLKITGGTLKVKDVLSGFNSDGTKWSEKINQIRVYSGLKYNSVNEVSKGSICSVTGLTKSHSGEGFGFEKDNTKSIIEPILSYKVKILSGEDLHTALSSFRTLEEEDPLLNIEWDEQNEEISFKIMGEIQLEILKRVIKDRFNMEVEFTHGSISYRETIKAPVRGIGHYEPLRHYAEVHLLLEPAKRGAGITIKTNCSEDILAKNWQRLIMTHIAEKQHLGVLTGSPLTDVTITVVAGRAHQKHTEGGDFRQATYRAIRQGLMNAENVLLEPWYSFTLVLPSENTGRAMTDIQNMGGRLEAPELIGENTIVRGFAPVSKMREYHAEVLGYTKGRGKLTSIFSGYEECQNADDIIAEKNYDAEADISNTPDSVFCSHGAGFAVKWDEVIDYCHIEIEENKKDDTKLAERRVGAYIDSIASDSELMRIFEMTYGAVNRPKHNAFKLKKERTSVSDKMPIIKALPSKKEYLLIDGYNIIFAWDNLKKIADESLDLARTTLINQICNYQGVKGIETILVFDAYKVKKNDGEIEKIRKVTIVYTKEAETADMYIERVTHELGKKHKVRVATSDNLEQIIILGGGAIRVSAEEFKKEVDETEEQIRNYIKNL